MEHQTMADVVAGATRKRAGKHRWIERYLERLQSEKGLAADAILKEENARRRRDGVKAMREKFYLAV